MKIRTASLVLGVMLLGASSSEAARSSPNGLQRFWQGRPFLGHVGREMARAARSVVEIPQRMRLGWQFNRAIRPYPDLMEAYWQELVKTGAYRLRFKALVGLGIAYSALSTVLMDMTVTAPEQPLFLLGALGTAIFVEDSMRVTQKIDKARAATLHKAVTLGKVDDPSLVEMYRADRPWKEQ